MSLTPLKIAHRGGSGLWPENTMAAFDNAIAAGADGVELDVHLTKDNVLVVHHDESLKPAIARGPDGNWVEGTNLLIKNLTFEELQSYDIGRLKPGAAYGASYPEQTAFDGERIPSLEAVIDLVREKASSDFIVYTELKTALLDPTQSASPHDLADACVDLIEHKGFSAQTTFVAFDWRALARAKKRAPHIKNAFTTLPSPWADSNGLPEDKLNSRTLAMRKAVASGADFFGDYDWRQQDGASMIEKTLRAIASGPSDGWFAWHGDIQSETAALAAELNLSISAWTVDEPDEMQRLTDLGVAAILTDRPDRLNAL